VDFHISGVRVRRIGRDRPEHDHYQLFLLFDIAASLPTRMRIDGQGSDAAAQPPSLSENMGR